MENRNAAYGELNQDPLWRDVGGEHECYGFEWDRSFHPRTHIGIWRRGSVIKLHSDYRESHYGTDERDRTRNDLTMADWERLQAALSACGFWYLPSMPWLNHCGLDGATWKVTGERGSQGHSVECWSPPDGPFRDLGLLFIQLAELPVPEAKIY